MKETLDVKAVTIASRGEQGTVKTRRQVELDLTDLNRIVLRIKGTPGHWLLDTLKSRRPLGKVAIDAGQDWDWVNPDEIMVVAQNYVRLYKKSLGIPEGKDHEDVRCTIQGWRPVRVRLYQWEDDLPIEILAPHGRISLTIDEAIKVADALQSSCRAYNIRRQRDES